MLMGGVVPLGDFWVMGKLKTMTDTKELTELPDKKTIMTAVLTI